MALVRNILIFTVLLGLTGVLSQEITDQWVTNEEVLETQDFDDSRSTIIPYCNFRIRPLRRCFDCYTRLFCTPFFGITNACLARGLPYCNNGECSRVPSDGCF